MNPPPTSFTSSANSSRHKRAARAKAVVALVLIGTSGSLARLPKPSEPMKSNDIEGAAERFRFDAIPLAAPAGAPVGTGMDLEIVDGRHYLSRNVNKSVHHIRSWISSVGAAVTIEDLNGDGLPNDACWVCPTLNRVVITHTGSAGRNYTPKFLDAPALPIYPTPDAPGSDTTIAPMGSVAGDFNEDGRMDVLVYYWGRTPVIFFRNETPWPVEAAMANEAFEAVELCSRPERWFTNAATQADLDGDGHTDLILGNYFADGATVLDSQSEKPVEMQAGMSHSSNGGMTHFMLWRKGGPDGAGYFKAAAVELRQNGKKLPTDQRNAFLRGWTLALAAANFDANPEDLPGVYSANDFGPDVLLLPEEGTGANDTLVFNVVDGARDMWMPKSKVAGHDSFKGMGAYASDFDRDGIPDLSVSNIAGKWALLESHFSFRSGMLAGASGSQAREDFGHQLREKYHATYRRTGHIPLRDASEEMGMSRGGWGWDVKQGSFDNGTDLQFLRAKGFVHGHRLGRGLNDTDETRKPTPLAAGRWAVLHELATANDVLLAKPASWFPCQPGDDLSGRDPLAFFVADATGRYFDQNGMDQPFARVKSELKRNHSESPATDGSGNRLPHEADPLSLPMISRGIAIADVDGDGMTDFLVANQGLHQTRGQDGETRFEESYCFINKTPPERAGRCLQLRLLLPVAGTSEETRVFTGPAAEAAEAIRGRPAIGASATFVMETAEGPAIFSDFVDGGNGHSGRNSFDLHFGLGDWPADKPVRVLLRWRDPGVPGMVREEIRDFVPGKPGDRGAGFRHTVLLKADRTRQP